jgi:hypothetical protein
MRKKHVIAALLVVMLIVGVTTAYAISWYRIRGWGNRFIAYNYQTCYTFPNSHAVYQRIRLRPLTGDPDLRVFGYYSPNSTWYYLGGSFNGGLTQDIKRVPRYTYSWFQACVNSWVTQGSYYSLFYEGGV